MLASLSARATGSSGTGEDKSIPVDIHVGKLGDWLVARNFVKGKWQSDLVHLRERIDDASGKIPEDLDEIQAIIKEPGVLNYFQCRQILSILEKQLGDKAKNFLGMYKDDQLKEWHSIIKQYEKNNLGLAEASRIMERNTMYEIPALKNGIQKNEKEASDLQKKVISHEKTIEDSKRAFAAACEKLGIQGNDLRDEVIRLGNKLPELLAKVAGAISNDDVSLASKYYAEFATFLATAAQTGKEDLDSNVEARIPFLIEATQDNRLLEQLDCHVGGATKPDEAIETVDVDWGLSLEGGEETSGEVDWGIEASGGGEAVDDAGEVNWDIEVSEPVVESEAIEIDWSFDDAGADTSTSANMEEPVNWDLQVAPSDNNNGSEGKGTEEQNLVVSQHNLMDKQVRQRLLNDLIELDGFLKGRLVELKTLENQGDGSSLFYYFDSAPQILKDQTLDSVSRMSDAVMRCIDELSSHQLHELVMIKQGGKLLDRMVDSLEKKKAMASKLEAAINRMEVKRSQLLQSNGRDSAKLQEYVSVTLRLKEESEKALSALLDKRTVRIVGDINAI